MALFVQHFGSQVRVRAAEGFGSCGRSAHVLPRQSEICQHGVPFLVNDHVVWFQVSEDNVLLVQGLDAEQNLLDIQPGLVLAEALLDLEVLAQVATGAVIRDQEEVVLRLKGVAQLDNEWVLAHTAHDVAFRDRILLQIVALYLLL